MGNLVDFLATRVFKDLQKKEDLFIEHILRNDIKNPINGKITEEKLKAANISGIIHIAEGFDSPHVTHTGCDVTITLESDIAGVHEGDMLVMNGGRRIPITELPFGWYEERFILD